MRVRPVQFRSVIRGAPHGCRLGEGSLIRTPAVVYKNAIVGKDRLIGTGAIATAGKTFPDRSPILGMPAKAVRLLKDVDIARMRRDPEVYKLRRWT